MHNELTNLLPFDRQRALARDYLLRLGVVGTILVTTLVLIAALLLLPTYVFLSKSMDAEEKRLATIESTLSAINGSELSARLSALTSDARILTALADAPSASATIREALAVSRPGISLTGLVYTPENAETSGGTLSIAGTAATRDALRNYQLALQDAVFARTAVLPVSAYAKDSDIAFTITVTLAP